MDDTRNAADRATLMQAVEDREGLAPLVVRYRAPLFHFAFRFVGDGETRTACDYIDARLDATRRVVTFAAFERLFSLWHALHLPLFMMLLVAGAVHVFAVHLY